MSEIYELLRQFINYTDHLYSLSIIICMQSLKNEVGHAVANAQLANKSDMEE